MRQAQRLIGPVVQPSSSTCNTPGTMKSLPPFTAPPIWNTSRVGSGWYSSVTVLRVDSSKKGTGRKRCEDRLGTLNSMRLEERPGIEGLSLSMDKPIDLVFVPFGTFLKQDIK